jgi:hypothetical protein
MACWLLALTWTVQPKFDRRPPHDATWSKAVTERIRRCAETAPTETAYSAIIFWTVLPDDLLSQLANIDLEDFAQVGESVAILVVVGGLWAYIRKLLAASRAQVEKLAALAKPAFKPLKRTATTSGTDSEPSAWINRASAAVRSGRLRFRAVGAWLWADLHGERTYQDP